MAKKFNTGDIIQINPKSSYDYQGKKGEEYMTGEITDDDSECGEYKAESHSYYVRWSDGTENSYRAKDLILEKSLQNSYEVY